MYQRKKYLAFSCLLRWVWSMKERRSVFGCNKNCRMCVAKTTNFCVVLCEKMARYSICILAVFKNPALHFFCCHYNLISLKFESILFCNSFFGSRQLFSKHFFASFFPFFSGKNFTKTSKRAENGKLFRKRKICSL